jgi:hypothetical protein
MTPSHADAAPIAWMASITPKALHHPKAAANASARRRVLVGSRKNHAPMVKTYGASGMLKTIDAVAAAIQASLAFARSLLVGDAAD